MFLVSHGGLVYEKPQLLVKLPHRAGQTWEPVTSGSVHDVVGKWTAGAVARVRVPAGEFAAVRVDLSGTDGRGKAVKVTNWYAHGIGLVRLGDYLELKSFTPGKE